MKKALAKMKKKPAAAGPAAPAGASAAEPPFPTRAAAPPAAAPVAPRVQPVTAASTARTAAQRKQAEAEMSVTDQIKGNDARIGQDNKKIEVLESQMKVQRKALLELTRSQMPDPGNRKQKQIGRTMKQLQMDIDDAQRRIDKYDQLNYTMKKNLNINRDMEAMGQINQVMGANMVDKEQVESTMEQAKDNVAESEDAAALVRDFNVLGDEFAEFEGGELTDDMMDQLRMAELEDKAATDATADLGALGRADPTPTTIPSRPVAAPATSDEDAFRQLERNLAM